MRKGDSTFAAATFGFFGLGVTAFSVWRVASFNPEKKEYLNAIAPFSLAICNMGLSIACVIELRHRKKKLDQLNFSGTQPGERLYIAGVSNSILYPAFNLLIQVLLLSFGAKAYEATVPEQRNKQIKAFLNIQLAQMIISNVLQPLLAGANFGYSADELEVAEEEKPYVRRLGKNVLFVANALLPILINSIVLIRAGASNQDMPQVALATLYPSLIISALVLAAVVKDFCLVGRRGHLIARFSWVSFHYSLTGLSQQTGLTALLAEERPPTYSHFYPQGAPL